MKIGLYSITYLGCWYRGEALTLPELIRTAKKFGYDGVEIDGKRPHGNPLDWPRARCQELQRLASGEGIEIHGVAATIETLHVPCMRLGTAVTSAMSFATNCRW